ncbi:MAG: sugar transferase [Candidatus Limnocylindrales bacterium]
MLGAVWNIDRHLSERDAGQMIRRHGALLRAVLATVDGLIALALIVLISAIQFGSDWRSTWGGIFASPVAPALLMTLAWIAILWSQGLYRLRARWSFVAQVVAMARASGTMALVTFAALILLKLPEVSRLFLLILLPMLALASLTFRAVIHISLAALRRKGRNSRNVLVVGSGPSAVRFSLELVAQTALGLRVIGYVNSVSDEPSVGAPFLGTLGDLSAVLHDHVVDEVAICLDMSEWDVIGDIVEVCRAEGKVIRIPLAGAFVGGSETYVEKLSGMLVLSLIEGHDRQLALAIKRVIDATVSGVGLLIGSPFLALIALAIVAADGRPILFSHERVGLHGRSFRLLKFRTMVRDAERMRPELVGQNEIRGPAFKMTDDPRVTPIGRLLRRASLDELPQLWNVLRGEMSLVGPRPPLPSEVNEYDIWHRRRLSMKPGITGLWQVAARREADFDRWVEMDLQYIDRWSLWLDTKIALRTLPAMIRSEGR